MMTLLQTMNINATGMDVQAARVRIHANNMANLGTPGYQRQIPVLAERSGASFQSLLWQNQAAGGAQSLLYGGASTLGVSLLGTVSDATPGKAVYMPNHPEADKDGYVTLSNSNPLSDMADAMVANRMYEANLSLYGILRTMANKAIEVGSGR